MSEKSKSFFSLDERLAHGAFSIPEVCELKCISKTVVYEDIYAGRLPTEKFGRARRIAGPVVKAYVPTIGVVEKESA
jgi:excisionase family DNA binding protein